MKTILIIYPHWPPSNLAGVHRPRLIANFLSQLGWHPIIITVHEEFYEEKLDEDIIKTVNPDVEVFKTNAYPTFSVFGKRLIGDIGIRAWKHMYQSALQKTKERKIDFIWIPIPSWYTALLGRLLFEKTKIPYGIDYIDPWVSKLAPYHRILSKSWWVLQIAKVLEPIAVHRADLISGVSELYYKPVIERNFKERFISSVAMPYGFDPLDHQITLDNIEYPWPTDGSVEPYIYAGAFLPQSQIFITALFKSMANLNQSNHLPNKSKFYFLGTGNYGGITIKEYAELAGIGNLVVEIKDRFPFLHIQQFLRSAKGIMIIGSTEKHYTASKTFQSLLSNRPIFSIFHEESSALEILQNCNAATYSVRFKEDFNLDKLQDKIEEMLFQYLNLKNGWEANLMPLEQYSAKQSALKLVNAMEIALTNKIGF